MGEYISYRGDEMKIGTCENLFYVSFPKYLIAMRDGLLAQVAGNETPLGYAKPDSGFRFRFPFPDEDKLPLGDIGNFDFRRGVAVKVNPDIDSFLSENFAVEKGKDFFLEITQHKLVYRETDKKPILAVVLRDPVKGESFRVEDDVVINKLAREIVRNHIAGEADMQKKNFYRQLAARMLKGYRLQPPAQQVSRQIKQAQTKTNRKGRRMR